MVGQPPGPTVRVSSPRRGCRRGGVVTVTPLKGGCDDGDDTPVTVGEGVSATLMTPLWAKQAPARLAGGGWPVAESWSPPALLAAVVALFAVGQAALGQLVERAGGGLALQAVVPAGLDPVHQLAAGERLAGGLAQHQ